MSKKIINVVEDERDLNELVKSYLIKEGYEVYSYYTYDEAYKAIDKPCDLWILDIMLDDKSGFDLIEEIKNRFPNVPVVFTSARDKEFDRIIGLEKGSDDYITKPFSPKELVLRINNIIKRVYKESKRIQVGKYEIDEAQRIVYEGDQPIDLTTKEFDLLMLFIRNRGNAILREQILEQVFGFDSESNDSTITTHIKNIRTKLADFPCMPIKTVWGIGYKWEE